MNSLIGTSRLSADWPLIASNRQPGAIAPTIIGEYSLLADNILHQSGNNKVLSHLPLGNDEQDRLDTLLKDLYLAGIFFMIYNQTKKNGFIRLKTGG